MRMWKLIAAVVVAAAATPALATPLVAQASLQLTEAQIIEAIKAGREKKYAQHVSSCSAGVGFGGALAAGMVKGINDTGSFNVTISTNYGRIAFMAANAKRLYLPFGPESVTGALRDTPTVFVHAEPDKPTRNDNGAISIPAAIERIVLKSKVIETAVVQPDSFETEPVEWSNLFGGKLQSTRAVATFDRATFMELPIGDIDVVLVTVGGERRCKIGKGDQATIFGRR